MFGLVFTPKASSGRPLRRTTNPSRTPHLHACLPSPQLVSLSVDDPVPAIQDVTLSDVAGGTFTLRVMTDALGGEIDVETAEIGYSASAAAVELALEAASSMLGEVEVVRTISGEFKRCCVNSRFFATTCSTYRTTWYTIQFNLMGVFVVLTQKLFSHALSHW